MLGEALMGWRVSALCSAACSTFAAPCVQCRQHAGWGWRLCCRGAGQEGGSVAQSEAPVLIPSALCSADSFVNSQEWTLSRSVPELKVVSIHISPPMLLHVPKRPLRPPEAQ